MSNSWIGDRTRDAICARDSMVCCYCGKTCIRANTSDKTIDRGSIATLDHVISQYAIALMCGDNDAAFYQERKNPINLVVACMSCNSSKQHTPLEMWCAQTNKDYSKIMLEIERRVNTPLIYNKPLTNKQKRQNYGIMA
jgi:hypothetical protein